MPSPNKCRGNALEREAVDLAKFFTLNAERAWGSDGKALGKASTVDCVVGDYTVQCKRFKKFPKGYEILLPTTHSTDIVVFRQDGRPKILYAVTELGFLYNLMKFSVFSPVGRELL